ncbi:uncharacterized protein [Hetaerina americana]|uniref:uncharacterized protein isoform X2 n=1 Tax=Hetaerina americana TaxID=62018 RepID=UPI003A7F3EDA
MPDPVPMPIWNWLAEVWSNMADLADRIDDLICSFEGSGDTTMDTVAMLIFAWMVFGVFALLVGRYIYGRFISGSSLSWGSHKSSADDPAAVAAALTAAVALPPEEGSATPGAKGGEHRPRSVVPPTPPMRKRLSAKGSAPAPALKAPSLFPPPVTTGPEIESVKWVNAVFAWLYSDLTLVNDLVGAWIQSLNEATRKSVTEHGVGVEFVRVLPETHPPSLTNVFSDCAPNDDVTITCDCEASPALQLKAFRQKGDKVDVSHYRVNVNRLRARLNIFAISEKLTTDLKFDGWPEVKVFLAPVGVIKASSSGGSAALEEESQLREVIGEIVVGAIRGTCFSWNMGVYGTCPRLLRNVQLPGHRLPLHYDSMMNSTAERRLLVKVIKATGIGGDRDVHEPFCVIELDDPPQKNQTAAKKGTNCPVWDEHFLYDLSSSSAEILFEIYDRGAKMQESKFLGLGIVGVEELMVNPSQRQVIALQSRPYEADDVTGSLTVEFLFIEGAEIPSSGIYPSYKLKETSKTLSPSGKVITTTKTVFSKAGGESLTNGGDVLTDSALRDLEMRTRIPGAVQPSKSTLIIHSVQRQPQPHVVKVEQTETGCWQEVPEQQPGTREAGAVGMDVDGQTVSSQSSDERGRSRRKRRDFFGTIKRRLGRSRTRSKSMDPGDRGESLGSGRGGAVDPMGVLPPGAARSISADRARDVSAHSAGGYLNVPGVGGRGIDGNSTRSSLSEASGISGASTRTYVNEASTLVLETVENGIKRHYLVPITMATKTKWKKKGVKLHIYNDHTFVAKHLSGGTACQVCTKSVARRIGKQGYECRDCNLKCHKHCHVKADNNCPLSTIHNIELSLLPVLSE